MAIEQLIKGAFSKAFNKYIYNEMVVGKLAHTEFKTGVDKGDQVEVVMPGMVTTFAYDGGDLPEAENVETATTQVKIDKGMGVHFKLKKIQEDVIKNAKSDESQVELVKNYTDDAIKQFAAIVDSSYAKLYTRAGHYLDDAGSAINLTPKLAKEIFAYMQAKFQRGDGKGHTNWITNSMISIVPPEYQFYLGQLDDFYKGVESGHKKIEKGYIGNLYGWDILVSNDLARNSDGSVYPLFGIKNKTLAGGVSKDLDMQHYIPEKNFDTHYKGYALYGVGAPRADFLGAVKIKAPLELLNLEKTTSTESNK